jgi:hypothetical protein
MRDGDCGGKHKIQELRQEQVLWTAEVDDGMG